jgi:hypothetical protein
VQERGIDEHEWETRFEALEDDVRDAPAEALSSWSSSARAPA